MRRFKLLTQDGYEIERWKKGEIYNEDYTGVSAPVEELVREFPIDWQEVFDEELPTTPDPVNPQHYKKGEVECVKAIRSAVVDKKGYSAVATANVIKYLWRYESKGGIQDIEKALWYLNDLIEYEKGKVK